MPSIDISTRQVAVTPSDSVAISPGPAESLWIGVAGTLSYIPWDSSNPSGVGASAIATSVSVGRFPCRVVRVNLTGTSATGIVALY